MFVKIIEDSINLSGDRLTTMQLRYQRFIHSEFMTHRVFSRNASSSRAIPVSKMIEQVRNDPAMPVYWGLNIPGMQADEEASDEVKDLARLAWIDAASSAVTHAQKLMDLGIHKQVANRVLEPFQFINVIVTATDWDNFFELRTHKDAQPEFQVLARDMKEAMNNSDPELLRSNEWHLPYITFDEMVEELTEDLIMMSAARCARVSYNTHDGLSPSKEKDLELYHRLVGSKPIHASPIEHQATPLISGRSNNFKGWEQYRERFDI